MSNQGWECPKCGYVWSMIITGCQNCNRPDYEKFKTTTGTYAGDDSLRESFYANHKRILKQAQADTQAKGDS